MAAVAAPLQSDSKTLIADALRKIGSIATLPEVTVRIIKTVEDPRSSAAQLHAIISHDPALISRVLKVVNSSFYGLPGQIGSIDRAIVLLGLNAVKNIAVAASLGQLFRGTRLTEEFTARDLWKHCVSVATTARYLAKEMKLPFADEAFLAGMIHDIGILVALQTWPAKIQATCEAAKNSETPFCQLEQEIVGVDHQQLGAALAEQWKFPRTCQLVAGHHHNPAQLADSNRLLVTLIFVADTICAQARAGFNLTALHQKIEDGIVHDLAIDLSLIERTRANLPKIIEAASGVY